MDGVSLAHYEIFKTQLQALHAIVANHIELTKNDPLSNKGQPPSVTYIRQRKDRESRVTISGKLKKFLREGVKIPRVSPDEKEIKLSTMLNDEGALRDVTSVPAFLNLTKQSTTNEQRAMFLLVIRISGVECRNEMAGKKTALDVLTLWLQEAMKNKDTDMIVALLDTLYRLPFLYKTIKQTEFPTVFKELRKLPDKTVKDKREKLRNHYQKIQEKVDREKEQSKANAEKAKSTGKTSKSSISMTSNGASNAIAMNALKSSASAIKVNDVLGNILGSSSNQASAAQAAKARQVRKEMRSKGAGGGIKLLSTSQSAASTTKGEEMDVEENVEKQESVDSMPSLPKIQTFSESVAQMEKKRSETKKIRWADDIGSELESVKEYVLEKFERDDKRAVRAQNMSAADDGLDQELRVFGKKAVDIMKGEYMERKLMIKRGGGRSRYERPKPMPVSISWSTPRPFRTPEAWQPQDFISQDRVFQLEREGSLFEVQYINEEDIPESPNDPPINEMVSVEEEMEWGSNPVPIFPFRQEGDEIDLLALPGPPPSLFPTTGMDKSMGNIRGVETLVAGDPEIQRFLNAHPDARKLCVNPITGDINIDLLNQLRKNPRFSGRAFTQSRGGGNLSHPPLLGSHSGGPKKLRPPSMSDLSPSGGRNHRNRKRDHYGDGGSSGSGIGIGGGGGGSKKRSRGGKGKGGDHYGPASHKGSRGGTEIGGSAGSLSLLSKNNTK